MKTLAYWLRRIADRIDRRGAPKITHWTFTFEQGLGVLFREDGRGCPIAYLGDDAYRRAHDEAGPIWARLKQGGRSPEVVTPGLPHWRITGENTLLEVEDVLPEQQDG